MILKEKNICLIFLLITFSKIALSQTYNYKNYSVEDGLPSSEVYSAFQDSKGYIWFATDAGVSRFDGYDFENFDKNDWLTDNTVFLISEDYKKRVWAVTFNCQLTYYRDNKWYKYKHNDLLEKELPHDSRVVSFYVDANDNIWLGVLNYGLIKVDNKGNIDYVNEKSPSLKLCYILNGNKTLTGTLSQRKNIVLAKDQSFKDSVEITTYDKELKKISSNKIYYQRSLSDRSTQNTIFSSDKQSVVFSLSSKQIYLYKENKTHKIHGSSFIKGRILSLNINNNDLWICIENQGVFKCKIEGSKLVIKKHFLSGNNISTVFIDKEKNLWFQSLDNGVYFLSSNNRVKYYLKQTKINDIEVDSSSGELYILTNKGKLIKKRGDSLMLFSESKKYQKLKYDDFSNQLFVGSTSQDILIFSGNKKSKLPLSIYNQSFKDIYIKGDTIYKTNHLGFSVIINRKEKYFSFKSTGKKIWCTSLGLYEGKIIVGTNKGLMKYKNDTLSLFDSKNKHLKSSITAIKTINTKTLLIGTKSKGLFIIEKGEIKQVINKNKGLKSNIIRAIHLDDKNNIWLGTGKGLSNITIDNNFNYKINNLTKKQGLISEEITDIDSRKDTLYVATNNGLLVFDKKLLAKIDNKEFKPEVFIKVFANGIDKTKNTAKKFRYNENNIKFQYLTIFYKNFGETEYNYRLLGVDSNWNSTLARSVEYLSLPSGDFVFEVKAKNHNGTFGDISRINFTIKKPFWLSWWFILILNGLLLLTGLGVIKYRENKIKQKAKTENELLKLELKALRAQMNPHFIFNTLNSIQHFLSFNDFKSTNKYLTQFAKLIRLVLTLSEKQHVSLVDELEMLKLYLNLERMRFEEGFKYTIDIDNEVNIIKTKIPSMIIQPYIENAIWHGLTNKQTTGIIQISIKKDKDYLICIIRDNGIGRKKASEIEKKRKIKSKSFGMAITQDRLKLQSDGNVKIKDLYNKKGEALGTEVIIKIKIKHD